MRQVTGEGSCNLSDSSRIGTRAMCINEVSGEQHKGAAMQVDMAGGTRGEEGGIVGQRGCIEWIYEEKHAEWLT